MGNIRSAGSRVLPLILMTLALLVSVAKAAPDPATREEYKKRAQELDSAQFAARLTFALWCIDKDLLDEAQAQLSNAAVLDPKNDELVAAWTKLAEKMPRQRIVISVTLEDGNVIRGVCSPMPFLIKNDHGVVLVTLDRLKGLNLVKQGKTPVVEVLLPEGRFQGTLLAPPLVIKSSLGEFSVPMEKVSKFFIEGQNVPPKDDTPAAGEVSLNWDAHLARLKAHGLDVVFVFDSTGSMGGIILESKTRIRQLMKVVTYLVPNARVGAVTYRDKKEYDLDDYEYTVKFIPLQNGNKEGLDKLQRFLRETEAYGGGDAPEAVLDGVQAAVEKGGWNAGAAKVIILFGDAPPRPENLTTLYDLCKRWKAGGGIISCIDTHGGSRLMPEFQRIASAGGGEATFLNDERAIMKQLVVFIFGSKWEKEIDKVYGTVLKGPEDTVVE